MTPFDSVILDLDGTLVDSVYQHVVAWQWAFHDVGLRVRSTQVHAAIGMGGDRLVAHVVSESAERAVGDRVRMAHDEHFRSLLPTVEELDGASELLEALAQAHRLVLASSGSRRSTDELVERVSGGVHLTGTLSGSDVERSKPAPDLLRAAAESVSGERPVVIGDSVWDVLAANEAGYPCLALTSGGIGAHALTDAGAAGVYEGPRNLLDLLGLTSVERGHDEWGTAASPRAGGR